MAKRLVILTVGKTHSGKTTFARDLEKSLSNSVVIDQDNHGAFINRHYKALEPKTGPNKLKHALSQLIVDYAKEESDCHLIICNSNRSRNGRLYLLNDVFPPSLFTRILVHFAIPQHILEERIAQSERPMDIFRSASTFEEVLKRQVDDADHGESNTPVEGEANHLFVIHDNKETGAIIQEIVSIAEEH